MTFFTKSHTVLQCCLTTTKNYYNPTQSYRLNKSAGGQCIPEMGGQHDWNIQTRGLI